MAFEGGLNFCSCFLNILIFQIWKIIIHSLFWPWSFKHSSLFNFCRHFAFSYFVAFESCLNLCSCILNILIFQIREVVLFDLHGFSSLVAFKCSLNFSSSTLNSFVSQVWKFFILLFFYGLDGMCGLWSFNLKLFWMNHFFF